ncbi:CidA/LrgA family protein [Leptolyngbya cf. ectocarpi LEGE 11479]|uniref:CidA/LrgA family protein n=1 Tax=Leptolyngbya cf. ectocarpi LEGE 11479 TaxID=1828722 RepID=A0A928ZR75_LEPEC|nr:CidA/LrgA family protein [Leptolyngbya ectocarpi]MBE9066238.1 CidA/LrgA family protein [Leptolyngbya cf. ectocarpi LEGE 11479]
MNFLNGITWLLLYELVGEVSVLMLPIPIPGPVVGMVLLFLTLLLRGRSTAALDAAGTTLLSHLSLLFVPAGVGLMVHFERIAQEWVAIGTALVLSTGVAIATTAITMQLATRYFTRGVKTNG